MPEWTCGRCTFINHELLNNCEVCEAPKEAAQVQYLEEETRPTRPEIAGNSLERQADEHVPMEQTTQEPPTNDRMDTQTGYNPPVPDCTFNDCLEAGSTGLSLTETDPGNPECSSLPTPMAPVVLHSTEPEPQLESPMSEPEMLNGAMSSPVTANEAEENGWSFLDNEVRLVIIGKTGVGKSTTGNNILGSNTFKSSASGASVTKKCQLGWASRFNRDIQIIDTPGLFDTGMSNEDITREIVKCIGMTSPGPHAFILVIRLDRFTAEEKATVDHFINIFGKDMLKYLVVLFTRMDDLKYDGTTLEEYLQNVPPDLKSLLEACNHRSIGFDNRGTQEEKNQDVQDLLKLIDGMVTSNGGGHYTNEMFEEAERIIAEQEEEHLKKTREQMKQEMARLREEVEEELRKKEEEKMREEEQMKGKMSELGIGEDDEEWVQVFGSPDLSPAEEEPREMISLSAKVTQGAISPEKYVASTVVNGTVADSNTKQDKPETFSSLNTGNTDTAERKPADDYVQANDAVQREYKEDASLSTSRRANQGSVYEADSYTGPQETPTHRSFVSNESMSRQNESIHHERKSVHQRELEELRERRAKLEAKHRMDKQRMRADYMARQSEAYDAFNRKHQESRQRYRREIHNANSGIFTKMFGAMKRFIRSTARGIHSFFTLGGARSCNGHVF